MEIYNNFSPLDKRFMGRNYSVMFGLFCVHVGHYIGWLRLFGYGIAWKNTEYHPYLFSERFGYTKTLKIGDWSFKILKKK